MSDNISESLFPVDSARPMARGAEPALAPAPPRLRRADRSQMLMRHLTLEELLPPDQEAST